MKKYYLKPIIILSTMIIMVLGFNYIAKYKVDVKTIKGDIKNIGDVSLVYTPAVKDFKKEEIVISKDGIKNYSKKEYPIGRDFIDIDKEYSQFSKGKYSDFIYQNDEYIGSVTLHLDWYSKKNSVSIEQKNKKTKEVESINIPINKNDDERDALESLFNTTYGDDLYMVILAKTTDKAKIETLTDKIYIVKVDIKNKTCEFTGETEIEKDYYSGQLKFKYEDKIYIENSNYTEKGYYRDFYIYDMNNKLLTKTKERTNEKEDGYTSASMLAYNIENNKLNIFIKNRNSNISKLVYSINEESIKLEDSVDYNFSIDYEYFFNNNHYYDGSGYGYNDGNGINKLKIIDDKIYSINKQVTALNKETENGRFMSIEGIKPIKFKVFDMKQNKMLYEAEIITGEKYIGNKLHLVKNY